jgi:hypothetical protein
VGAADSNPSKPTYSRHYHVSLFGFEVEETGGAEAARAIELLVILWCIPGFLRNEWTHASKLLRN